MGTGGCSQVKYRSLDFASSDQLIRTSFSGCDRVEPWYMIITISGHLNPLFTVSMAEIRGYELMVAATRYMQLGETSIQ
ncbi:unnamed protein product [Macrosiphum euphorbiae]|uniref:Uncharacterized protein n=1 Tax=Macrosiphum euphorbiae TaxID=13131 RepID=A0AAV0XR45_9HEMI|nr:unnamed protein product [Macrosiphum euphorbiae]